MSSSIPFASLACSLVVFLAVAGGLVFFLMRKRDSGVSREAPAGFAPAPLAREIVCFLRFEGEEDESYVQDIARRFSRISSAAQARDAALALVRAAPTATHAWLGPKSEVPDLGAIRSGLGFGAYIGLYASARTALDTVADDRSLDRVVQTLRDVAKWTDAEFVNAQVLSPQAGTSGPVLVAVNPESRPGMQLCAYCGHPNPAHETVCANCGARAAS